MNRSLNYLMSLHKFLSRGGLSKYAFDIQKISMDIVHENIREKLNFFKRIKT